MQIPHNELINDVTGVILAGGKSQRMQCDKANLQIAGQSLFTRIVEVLQGIFPRVLIAGNRPDIANMDLPAIPDIYPGSALGGIFTGLSAVETPWTFIAPCDMPYPNPDLIRLLLDQREGASVVVPRSPAGLEPVFALYHKDCLQPMMAMLENGNFRIYELYSRVQVNYLDATLLPSNWQQALCNINTPEDLARLIKESS